MQKSDHAMDKSTHDDVPDSVLITPTAPIANHTHGGRAKCLQRLVRLDLPVPTTVALSFEAVHAIANGGMPDLAAIVGCFAPDALLCVRPDRKSVV